MNHSSVRLVAVLAAVAGTPASAQGILSKARYAAPPLTAAALPAAAVAMPLPAATGPGAAAVGASAAGSAGAAGTVSVSADGVVTITMPFPEGGVIPCPPDAVAVVPGHPGAIDGGLPPAGEWHSPMPLLPAPAEGAVDGNAFVTIMVPPGVAEGGVAAAVMPAAPPGARAVTGTPTAAGLLRAANAQAHAAVASGSQPPSFAQQIRDQVRQATGGLGRPTGGGRVIGPATATFGIPADARPLVTSAPTEGPRGPGPAVGLPRTRPAGSAGPAQPRQVSSLTPAATPSVTSSVPGAGAVGAPGAPAAAAPARATPAIPAGVSGARAVPPAVTAPRWRDRISFAWPTTR